MATVLVVQPTVKHVSISQINVILAIAQ